MDWLLISLLPPLFWSCSNILDEYIAKRNALLTGKTFIILATAISTLPGFMLLAFKPDALFIGWDNIFIFTALGTFFSFCFWPYIVAIKEDGAGFVVPLFQTLPLFIFLMAWIFLGETISAMQFIICLLVMAASAASMIDEVKGFRLKSLCLMLISCLMLGIYVTLTRYYVETHHWLDITIWNYIGSGLLACLFVAAHKPTMNVVKHVWKDTGITVTILFFLQAVTDVAANALWVLALSLAPAAGLVQTVSSVQPFYILLFSAIAFYALPEIFEQPPKGKYLAWRIACFTVIVAGIGILSMT